MADERLESNVVLQTHLPKPKGSGFKDVLSGLDKLEKRLDAITKKTWTIKVKIDDSQAKKLGISFGGGGGGGGVGGGGSGTGPMGSGPSASGRVSVRQKKTRITDEGATVTNTEIQESIKGFDQLKNKVQEVQDVYQETTSTSTNLLEKQRVAADRQYARQVALKKVEQERLQALRAAEQKVTGNVSTGNAAYAGLTSTERRILREEQRRVQASTAPPAVSHAAMQSRYQQLLGEGYQQYTTRSAYNKKSGQFEQEVELRKIQGNALQGYTVQVAKANLATNQLRERTVQGAEAFRMVGDSIANAAVKVATWLTATTLVFATIRGFQMLGLEIMKLEEGSILLARVGRNLGSSFEERLATSKRLTQSFLEMTAIIGGTASEAQKAAAIFARAGYDEVEILQAVKASLFASRIAELDVVESAQLLSAATLQFNQRAGEILPTLDLLNTYSNNFRVTTDDLLQSISRTGSVIAQQNGRISELAAVTAITAQSTSRSGAEIGNAVKTIVSNLDRLETRQQIFDKLGISMTDADGNTKSYTRTLSELAIKTKHLTAAERDQLSINIAGLRQRNVLLVNMKDSLEIVQAELQTLMAQGKGNQNSALAEFGGTAGSMTSALKRLQAQAINVGSNLSGPFLEVAKAATNLLERMLALLAVYNGAPAKIVGFVAIIGAVLLGLRYLDTTYKISIQSITAYIVRVTAAAIANFRLAISNGTLATSFMAMTTNLLSGTQALIAANGPAILLSLAIIAIADAVNLAAAAHAKYQAMQESEISNFQASASAAKGKAQAYRIAADAVTDLVIEMQQLRKEEISTGKKNPRIDELRTRAARISGDMGMMLGGDRIPNAVAFEKQALEQSRQAREQQAEAIRGEIKVLREKNKESSEEFQRLEKLNKSYKEYTEAIKAGNSIPSNRSPAKRDYQRSRTGGGFFRDIDDFSAVIEEKTNKGQAIHDRWAVIVKELADAQKKQTEGSEQEAKLQKLITDLKVEQANAAKDIAKAELTIRAKEFQVAEKKRKDRDEVRDFTRGLFGGATPQQLQSDYNASAQETQSIWKDLIELQDTYKIDTEILKATQDAYNASLQRTVGLGQKIRSNAAASIRKEARARLDYVGDLNLQAGLIAFQRQRGMSDTSSTLVDPIAQNAAERALLMQGIERDRQVAATTTNPFEAKEAQLRIAEQLENLRGLEKDHALALLRVEKDIAIARKQSADEAARALGTMSTTDKLTALGAAAYFAKNPNAKIPLSQQFLMSGESVGVVQRMFGGHLAGMEDQADPLARLLRAAGAGGSPELNNAQKEYAEARGRLTSRDILERSIQAGGAAGDAKNRIEGNAAAGMRFSNNLYNPNLNREGNMVPNIPINVQANVIDWGPLQRTFENSFITIMDEKISKMGVWFQELLEKRNRTDPKFPKINSGGVD